MNQIELTEDARGQPLAYAWGMTGKDIDKPNHNTPVLTVIPDANVLIHGKALTDLPWHELKRPAVEVLLVPPLMRELDKLKNQSGRPNKIARQISSDVRGLLSLPERRAVIRKSAPLVTKRLELRAVNEVLHEALRLDHPDQALINYALHLQADGHDVLLLTDDTICGTTAQEVGLPMLFLPDAWLRDAEPDEHAKERAKLQAEIKRLADAEPRVALNFRDEHGNALERIDVEITRWPALSVSEIDGLMEMVRQLYPQATSFEREPPSAVDQLLRPLTTISQAGAMASLRPRSVYEPATEAEIERYKTETYPEWLDSVQAALGSLHERLEVHTAWPAFGAFAVNAGTRPATEALLRLRAHGAFSLLNSGDEDGAEEIKPLTLPSRPKPPRGKMRTIDPLGIARASYMSALSPLGVRPSFEPLDYSAFQPRSSDAFYWRSGREGWVALMELECASWRHGEKEITFSLKIRPEHAGDITGMIEFHAHANNISTPLSVRLPLQIKWIVGSTVSEAHKLVDYLG